MANNQNLRPGIYKLSVEEAKKGGVKSGEARRKKATMRETLKLLLETEAKNGQTYKELATIGLIKGAVKGNSNNYRVILETLGELFEAEQKKQSNGVIDNLIEALNNVKNSK